MMIIENFRTGIIILFFQSLYCRYDKEGLSRDEQQKLYKSDRTIRGTGVIIRHHNPAYQAGVSNSGFVKESAANGNVGGAGLNFGSHLYNNGHAQFVVCESDTDQRSLGEVFIPMETFGPAPNKKNIVVNPNGTQILDVSKL
jgi:hypothetical protein